MLAALALLSTAAWYDAAIPVVAVDEKSVQIMASGMLLAPDLLLTANHATPGLNGMVVIACGNELIEGQVVASSATYDLAAVVLAKNCTAHPVVRLSKQSPRVGERITIIGFPAGLFRMATTGIVSAYSDIKYTADSKWSLITDATLFGGNSGGPVFNAKHEVIGVVSAGLCLGKGACYGVIVPLASIISFLNGA